MPRPNPLLAPALEPARPPPLLEGQDPQRGRPRPSTRPALEPPLSLAVASGCEDSLSLRGCFPVLDAVRMCLSATSFHSPVEDSFCPGNPRPPG